jgi:hypothetical protein
MAAIVKAKKKRSNNKLETGLIQKIMKHLMEYCKKMLACMQSRVIWHHIMHNELSGLQYNRSKKNKE